MSEHREDDAKRERHTHGEDHGWMAEFEEDLRRMHLERPKQRGLTSVLLAKLREWWRRAR
jgi:hypothetical protein